MLVRFQRLREEQFKIHLSLVSSAYFYYQVDFNPRYDTSPVVSYGQVHIKLFTGIRELSFAIELPKTLVQVLRKFDHSIFNGFAQRGVE